MVLSGQVADREVLLPFGSLLLDPPSQKLCSDGIVGGKGLALLRGINMVWDRWKA